MKHSDEKAETENAVYQLNISPTTVCVSSKCFMEITSFLKVNTECPHWIARHPFVFIQYSPV